jgi:hypothetical protein
MNLVAAIRNDMPELTAIRRELHAHPELGLEEVWTSDYVARRLEEMGYEVTRGLAKTGLVATMRNGTGTRSVGIRADMDALPMREDGDLSYRSVHPDRMRQNLELTSGALFSQRALTALVESGRSRDEAYRVVQEAAQRAWDTGTHFRELIAQAAPELDVDQVLDPGAYLAHVDEVLARLEAQRG